MWLQDFGMNWFSDFPRVDRILRAIRTSEDDSEMRAALAHGWRRHDLLWEREQERGNSALVKGDRIAASRCFRGALRIARANFEANDPRRATSVANLGYVARMAGHEALAREHYAEASGRWLTVPKQLDGLEMASRGRSSAHHLRMEARHWQTYVQELRGRLALRVNEAAACLEALAAGREGGAALYPRWRGEKPAVFDDTRILLASCLLIANCPGKGVLSARKTR